METVNSILNVLCKLNQSSSTSKIRLNKSNGKNGMLFLDAINDPNETKNALNGGNWNYSHRNEFGDSELVYEFAKVSNRKNEYVLFCVEKIVLSNGQKDGVGYEWEVDHDYDDLIGKLVIEYKVKRGESCVTQSTEKILSEASKIIILKDSLINDEALVLCKTNSFDL